MSTKLMAPPSMEDARMAAGVVAAAGGVSEILVFGSVARGEAGPYSDIDLVAIHDDLDYSTRRERSEQLGQDRLRGGGPPGVRVRDRLAGVGPSQHRGVDLPGARHHHRYRQAVPPGPERGALGEGDRDAYHRPRRSRRPPRQRSPGPACCTVRTHLVMSPSARQARWTTEIPAITCLRSGAGCVPCALKLTWRWRPASRPSSTSEELARPAPTTSTDCLGGLPAGRAGSAQRFLCGGDSQGGVEVAGGRCVRVCRLVARPACTPCLPHGLLAVSRYVAHRFPETDSARVIGKVTSEIERMLDRWDLAADDPYEVLGQSPPPGPPS